MSSEFLALDSGEKVGGDMNKKYKKSVKYTDKPIKLGRRVVDFPPSPAKLAKAAEVMKVTISLSSKSVNFFKRTASRYNTPYQRIIRKLLDE